MELKQVVKKNLEILVESTLIQYGGDESLAYDVAKQCVTQEDADNCLATMLENLSERELELIFQFHESETYQKFLDSMNQAYMDFQGKIREVLYTLSETGGSA